jgi:fucose 4-O-acetylase-like acetyltransferase
MNPASGARDTTIEHVRGFALVLVVLGHALGGEPAVAKFLRFPGWCELVGAWIYSFHMPLFVFCAGAVQIYSNSSKREAGWNSFVLRRAKRLLVPFFAMAILLHAPVASWVMGTSYPSNLFAYLTGTGGGQLWFLWMLFCLQLISRLFDGLAGRKALTIFVWLAAYYMALAKGKFHLEPWFSWNSVLALGIWYSLGQHWILIQGYLLRVSRSPVWLIAAWISQVALHVVAMEIPNTGSPLLTLIWHSTRLVVSGLGILASFATIMMLQERGSGWLLAALKYIDSKGMTIYLLHGPLQWVLAAASSPFLPGGAAFVVCGTLVGILAPVSLGVVWSSILSRAGAERRIS